MTKLRLIDGTQFYLPSSHARHFRSLHPQQEHSEAPWERILAIAQPEMRMVANCLLYGVLPELCPSQAVLLSRIAATYGLPTLGAALGLPCDEKVESPGSEDSVSPSPASSWIIGELRAQGFAAEAERGNDIRYSVKLPACKDIVVHVPRHQMRFCRAPKGWHVTPEVWIRSLQGAHEQEAQKMRGLVKEAQDIACKHGWQETITIRLKETGVGRLTTWARWPRSGAAVFKLSAATADFEARTARPKERRRLLAWKD